MCDGYKSNFIKDHTVWRS